MKKLKSLKLNQLSKAELEKREMNILKGGLCQCGSTCTCDTDTTEVGLWYTGAYNNGTSTAKA